MLHPVSPWVTHQFQYLAHLLHVERLAHIDHINGLIEVIFREFHDRQGDFLGGIQRGAVGAQNDHHPVFLFGAQFFVEVDDDRVFGAAIFSQPAFDQLVDHRLSRLFHFAFKVDPVEMLTQEFVNLVETFHRPVTGLLPKIFQVLLAGIPAPEIGSHRSFKLRLTHKSPVCLRVEVRHPAHRIMTRLLASVVHLVVAHPFDHVQTDVADVVGANHLLAARLEDVTDRAA